MSGFFFSPIDCFTSDYRIIERLTDKVALLSVQNRNLQFQLMKQKKHLAETQTQVDVFKHQEEQAAKAEQTASVSPCVDGPSLVVDGACSCSLVRMLSVELICCYLFIVCLFSVSLVLCFCFPPDVVDVVNGVNGVFVLVNSFFSFRRARCQQGTFLSHRAGAADASWREIQQSL